MTAVNVYEGRLALQLLHIALHYAGMARGEIKLKEKGNVNRLLNGFRFHLGLETIVAKITANVWEIAQFSTLITLLVYIAFWQKNLSFKRYFKTWKPHYHNKKKRLKLKRS